MMAARLNKFEQFLTLFESLKTVAGEPKRLATFYSESSAIRDAADKLGTHAGELARLLSDRKRFGRVPPGFEQAWTEYSARWVPAIDHASLSDFFAPTIEFGPYDPDNPYAAFPQANKPTEPQEPDPEDEDKFYPQYHDGGSALKLGVNYWRSECDAYTERVQSGSMTTTPNSPPTNAASRSTHSTILRASSALTSTVFSDAGTRSR